MSQINMISHYSFFLCLCVCVCAGPFTTHRLRIRNIDLFVKVESIREYGGKLVTFVKGEFEQKFVSMDWNKCLEEQVKPFEILIRRLDIVFFGPSVTAYVPWSVRLKCVL